MKTWEDYKRYVRSIDEESCRTIEKMEDTAAIVSSMIEPDTTLDTGTGTVDPKSFVRPTQ